MREFQKVYREAQLAGDKGKLKKLEKERAEVMELSMDVQAQTMRPMPYILIISLPLFGWLSYIMSQTSSWPSQVSTKISLPYFGELPYAQGIFFGFPVWIIWYLVCSLVLLKSFARLWECDCWRRDQSSESCQFSRALSPLSSKGRLRFYTQP
jgi:uncharacterized membrane protein (DUF106 family)